MISGGVPWQSGIRPDCVKYMQQVPDAPRFARTGADMLLQTGDLLTPIFQPQCAIGPEMRDDALKVDQLTFELRTCHLQLPQCDEWLIQYGKVREDISHAERAIVAEFLVLWTMKGDHLADVYQKRIFASGRGFRFPSPLIQAHHMRP